MLGAGAINALTNPETAASLTQGIQRQFSKTGKLYRQQLKEDRRRLAANDFGLTEAEKNAAMGGVARQQMAATKGIEADLNRQGAAAGFGRSAVQAEAVRGLGADLANQQAAARGELESVSAQLGQQQREAALARQAARRGEIDQQAAQLGKTSATAAADFEAGFRGAKAAKAASGQAAAVPGSSAKAPLTHGARTAADEEKKQEAARKLVEQLGLLD